MTHVIHATSGIRPSRLPRYTLLLALWGAGLWGSLKYTQGESPNAHSLCGIWGCGPPTHVLIGWHLFWCVALAPLFRSGLQRYSGDCLLHLGYGLSSTGLLAALGVIGFDLAYWWPDATELQRSFVGRRILFSFATSVDIPALQIVVAGSLYIIASRFRRTGGTCPGSSCSLPAVSSDSEIKPTP